MSKNDAIPVVIEVPYTKEITIIPISDVHYGSKECDVKKFLEVVSQIKHEKNTYCVLVGDLINNCTRSSVSDIFEEVCSPRQQKDWMIMQLYDIRDKILCAVGGNHERRSKKDADLDPMEDIMFSLGREDYYRSGIAFAFIKMYEGKRDAAKKLAHKGKLQTYTFAITHGAGGGTYIGAGANRNERFGAIFDGLDVLVTGHTHKPVTFPVKKIVINSNKKTVTFKQFNVVVSSSFLNYGGYPIQKMLLPTGHNVTKIVLNGDNKKVKVIQE